MKRDIAAMNSREINALCTRVTERLRKARSAWSRGMTQYALDLLDTFKSQVLEAERDGGPIPQLTEAALLNGADSWEQYSCGGSSLIYDEDIAERLCTPSELKRCCRGKLRLNARETWLDAQTRALTQACRLVLLAADDIMGRE